MANELHDAAANVHGLKLVKQLIEEKKFNVNDHHTITSNRPVDYAAQSGSLETLEYLIEEAKVDLNASHRRYNLLFWAQQNKTEVLEYVINPQNHIIEQFGDGTTRLHVAALTGQIDEIHNLLRFKPSRIRECDTRGNTAIYWAALADSPTTINALTTHPAFIHSKNASKFDPMFRGHIDRRLVTLSLNGEKITPSNSIKIYKEVIRCVEQIRHKNKRDHSVYLDSLHSLSDNYLQENNYTEAIAMGIKAVLYCGKLSDNLADKISWLTSAHQNLQHIRSKDSLQKEARKWGFVCTNVPEDGNCFFSACLEQFKLHSLTTANFTVSQLRAQTVNFMSQNFDQFIDFIEEDAEEYLNAIEKDGAWVDHLVILAFSRCFNVNIVILRNDEAEPTIIKQAQANTNLYLGHEVEVHYQSLSYIANWSQQSIQNKIQQAETDTFQLPQALPAGTASLTTFPTAQNMHIPLVINPQTFFYLPPQIAATITNIQVNNTAPPNVP
ncbi:MAG: ankyrin repeat domain-containing protein [Legionella sp.]|jgi:hypothetical protein